MSKGEYLDLLSKMCDITTGVEYKISLSFQLALFMTFASEMLNISSSVISFSPFLLSGVKNSTIGDFIYKLLVALMQEIEQTFDLYLQQTQFGFRQRKGTKDALHCIRRAIEYGEKAINPALFVLLDWEKAFDKVTH